jgi:hypothetical protein
MPPSRTNPGIVIRNIEINVANRGFIVFSLESFLRSVAPGQPRTFLPSDLFVKC